MSKHSNKWETFPALGEKHLYWLVCCNPQLFWVFHGASKLEEIVLCVIFQSHLIYLKQDAEFSISRKTFEIAWISETPQYPRVGHKAAALGKKLQCAPESQSWITEALSHRLPHRFVWNTQLQKCSLPSMLINFIFRNKGNQGWRGGSAIKSTCYSYREPESG